MIFLPETLTQDNAAAVLAELDAAAARAGAEVTLDASGLLRFDSTALSVLLDLGRRAQARGQRWSVHKLPERAAQLARVYGIAELLGS
ncbi:MAG: hypothetical protein OHK0048_02560 [Rhodoferax sp.]